MGMVADLIELPSIAWATTLIFQGAKHSRFIDQDRAKWWILLLISAAVGYGICYLHKG